MPPNPEIPKDELQSLEQMRRKDIAEIVRDYKSYIQFSEAKYIADNKLPEATQDRKLRVVEDPRFKSFQAALVEKIFDVVKKSTDKKVELHELLFETFSILRQNNPTDIPLFLAVVKTGLEEKIKEINLADLSEQERFATFMIFSVLSGSDISKMDDYYLPYREFLKNHGLSPDLYCKDQQTFQKIWEQSQIDENVRIISQSHLESLAVQTPKTEEEKKMAEAAGSIIPSDNQGRFIDRPKHLWNQTHWTLFKGTLFGLAGLTGILNIIGTGIRTGISFWDAGSRLIKERDPKAAGQAFAEGAGGVVKDVFSSKGLTSALGFLFFAKGDKMLDAINRGMKKAQKKAKRGVKEIKKRL